MNHRNIKLRNTSLQNYSRNPKKSSTDKRPHHQQSTSYSPIEYFYTTIFTTSLHSSSSLTSPPSGCNSSSWNIAMRSTGYNQNQCNKRYSKYKVNVVLKRIGILLSNIKSACVTKLGLITISVCEAADSLPLCCGTSTYI